MKHDIFILVTVVLFVTVLGVYFLAVPRPTELTYVPVEVAVGSITVSDQSDLNQVVLEQVELSDGGFVTIHETLTAAGGGAPAAIIGTSAYLEPGVHENVGINLTQEMLPGYPYITLLHVDNGDQSYETNEDLPAMVNGEVVRPNFTAAPDLVELEDDENESSEESDELDESESDDELDE